MRKTFILVLSCEEDQIPAIPYLLLWEGRGHLRKCLCLFVCAASGLPAEKTIVGTETGTFLSRCILPVNG